MEKLPSGSGVIDELLEGGYEAGIVTTIYGPSSSGKTNLCLIAALEAAQKKKVIFIDTEGGTARERIAQLARGREKLAEKILFLRPTTFQEQAEAFSKLRELVDGKIGLIVVDTITMLYRVELGNKQEVYDVNKLLGRQLSHLVEIARKRNIPVLVSAQVYSTFDERNNFNIVGGDIIKYSSKCLIELRVEQDGSRLAILKKHRSLPERQVKFVITATGIEKPKARLFGIL